MFSSLWCNKLHMNITFSVLITVDGKSFPGLNFRSFDPMKYFVEILSQFIGQERLCYMYIDNYSRGTRVKYSWKNFYGPLQNHENRESLA